MSSRRKLSNKAVVRSASVGVEDLPHMANMRRVVEMFLFIAGC